MVVTVRSLGLSGISGYEVTGRVLSLRRAARL